MDLQISAFLLFVLFSAGHSLSCFECSGGPGDVSCSNRKVNICRDEHTMCSSSTSLESEGSTTMHKSQRCSRAEDCHHGSLNFGFQRGYIECCDTDLCNIQLPPDPRTLTPNGKKCYSCDETSCLNIMSCSGSEDGCITMTSINRHGEEPSRNSGAEPKFLKGCITKKMCDSMANQTRGTEIISCCSGNLCNGDESVSQSGNGVKSVSQRGNGTESVSQRGNGAESVSQSFLFLCCSLLSFILLH